ncbi:MAG: Na+/H+ antiporter [Planctomycetes bacterium]|nr:Na+/H+ antiporter [Planctomycetota bacterium]
MPPLLPVLIGLLIVVSLVAFATPRTRIPAPVLLALGGVLLGLVPGLPLLELDPDLILLGFLPPLLYSDAFLASWTDFRRWMRPILMLAVGLVAVTTLLVGFVLHWVLPELALPACFLLGAIVSPTDTVAVQAVLDRLRIPRRMTAILGGENLVNDATGLFGVQLGTALLAGGTFGAGNFALDFLWIGGGGVLAGVLVGGLGVLANSRARRTELLFALSLLAPYLAFLAAHMAHASGVVAVVVAGFMVSWRIHDLPPPARVELFTAWRLLTWVLNAFCFVLIGLETPALLRNLHENGTSTTIFAALVVAATVIFVRVLWMFPAAYLPLYFSPRLRAREGGYPAWRAVTVVSWCGIRGVVSLAAALSVPLTLNDAPFPGRETILACTLAVILITLFVQAPTLHLLIGWLGLSDEDTSGDEVRKAREALLKAGIARLDEFCTQTSCPISVHHWRTQMEDELASLEAADAEERERARTRHSVSRDVHRAVAQAHAAELLRLRNLGQLNDKCYLELQLDLDRENPEYAEADFGAHGH